MNAISKFVLQAMTPSWKFFEEVGQIPRLSVRPSDSEGALVWTVWQPKFHRGISQLFMNPEGNFELAKVTLVERFVDEISEAAAAAGTDAAVGPGAAADADPGVDNHAADILDQEAANRIVESMSYALVKALSREVVKNLFPHVTRFQFRIELIDQRVPSSREEIFVSEECEA